MSGKRAAVSHEVLIIRFPDGDAEIYAGQVPAVGDKLVRRNAEWIVSRVGSSALGGAAVTVTATDVVRDGSWPDPYGFIRAHE
jgi:hypothetical protein